MSGPSYGDERLFLIIADTPAGAALATAAVADGGGRVADTVPLAAATTRLDRQSRIDGVIVELAGTDEDAIAELLPVVARQAQECRAGMVVAVSHKEIDAAWAAIPDGTASVVCDATITDRVVALAALSRTHALHDVSRADDERMRQLNAEVSRFAETLMRLSRDAPETPGPAARESPLRFGSELHEPPATSDIAGTDVRNLIRARRLRSGFFPGELFADPAWDMLLDLFAAGIEHRRVSVSSLCIAAAVPGTTALRWIGTMVDAGLFERQPDQRDRRRAYIGLSPRARSGMHGYFAAAQRAGLSPA
ncbi:hypothetical protein M9980_11450 [Sphingomonas donggukensis]|uniref:MarR family transcriptional regulator n=1 Tax=Sphingomonas donggukensis TaxID=2949093 RepID=A0ABY4TSA5_9SPHN|nr:hypothetical protein [Sphingomonas donggukensis]URW75157.1 hypothetical protein M9980_11450 [Sphingomonas donggukensis]